MKLLLGGLNRRLKAKTFKTVVLNYGPSAFGGLKPPAEVIKTQIDK